MKKPGLLLQFPALCKGTNCKATLSDVSVDVTDIVLGYNLNTKDRLPP